MSKGKAIILGVFTVWPVLYMVFFMCSFFGMMMTDFSGGKHDPGLPLIVAIIFPLHFLTMIIIFTLLVIYIVHLFKSDRIAQDKKTLWALVLFLGSPIAMPIFWYQYIWKYLKKEESEKGEADNPLA